MEAKIPLSLKDGDKNTKFFHGIASTRLTDQEPIGFALYWMARPGQKTGKKLLITSSNTFLLYTPKKIGTGRF